MRWRGLLLAAAVVAAAGCAGGAGRALPATTTSAAGTPTTERQIPSNNTTTTKPQPPTSTTTTAPETGLPDSLPIPSASIITLGSGSTISSGSSVYGVPLTDVHAWLLDELAAEGWDVTADDGAGMVAFTGPGASGTATLTEGDGSVDLRFILGGRAG
jgi:hypothetical protein